MRLTLMKQSIKLVISQKKTVLLSQNGFSYF
jgi:hypothetical protein